MGSNLAEKAVVTYLTMYVVFQTDKDRERERKSSASRSSDVIEIVVVVQRSNNHKK